MRQVIHGIYLGHINYSESSVIGRFYTQKFGKQSFVIKGAKSKKSKIIGLLQPLNELEIVSNFQETKNLNTSYGVTISNVRSNIHSDIRKTTIALFLSEILNKSIIEEEANFPLYQFILSNINALDRDKFDVNFHIRFLIELSLFMGFYPLQSNHVSNNVFNLEDGIFENENSASPIHLNKTISLELSKVLSYGANENTITKENRFELLDGLVTYYEIQLGLKSHAFHSHEILKTVFS
jgi:DNA repair protein RecO (recombination protein O)